MLQSLYLDNLLFTPITKGNLVNAGFLFSLLEWVFEKSQNKGSKQVKRIKSVG